MAKKKQPWWEAIIFLLNTKQAKWAGAFTLLGTFFYLGTIYQESKMSREYQLIDEQRIKEHNALVDELRNKVYDYREEKERLQHQVDLYELQNVKEDGKKE